MVNKKIIHTVFENTVLQKPDNIAIETEGIEISYSKLNSQSNQIAHLLKNLEIDKGDIVAVFFNQVLIQILCLIGIFKKGGIYLPLDKKYKQNHWGELFTNIKPKALLISQEYFEIVKEYTALYEYSIPKIIIVTLGPKMELEFSVYVYSDGTYVRSEFDVVEEKTNLELSLEGDDPNHIFFTSGSTGKPKAVLGNHKSLSHFIHWETKELKVTENDKVGQLTSLSFDASLRDIFLPLINGASICIPTTKIKEDVHQLNNWLKNEKITILHTVPTMLRLLLNADNSDLNKDMNFSTLRYLLLAGEKLYNRDITSWREKNGESTCIVNLYGATESTLVKSFHRVENQLTGKQSDSISVGKPISNTALIILNSNNKLCNVNEKGSIYIKTPFLSSGYYKDKTLTETKFIQNPLSSEKDIIYKTGDYGTYDATRNVTVLGREDGVIKINGIRCDINSIESTILELEEVSMVKCLIKENDDGNKSIIGFYTSNNPLEETIRNHCFTYLPHYEIPSLLIHLESFPTNANGKIDTIYLNNKVKEVVQETPYDEEPTNEIERKVLDIWKEILKEDQIGIKNSFLSLGGNSIKQVLLRSKIRTEFGIHLTIEDLFTYATVSQQASLVASRSVREYDTIKPVAKNTDGYTISNEQLRIWITSQSKEESIAHNMSYTYDIQGDFDVPLFIRAIETVINRYEILRTRFSINDEGNVVQKVSDNIEVEQLFTHLIVDVNTNEEQIKGYIASFNDYAFDLEKAPLFRLELIQIKSQKFILSTLMHHIIGDYTSDQIIIGEILKLYNSYKTNSPITLNKLEVQYKDYASWITKRLANNEFVTEKQFWLDHLKGVFKQEKWYTPVATIDYKGEYFIKNLSETLTQQINSYCSEYNQNLMSVFASALGILIHKISGQREIIIGLPINLRTHPDLLNQVGLYLNLLPLKIKVDPQNSVKTVLDKASKDQIKMMDNSFYPFDNIIEDFEQENSINLLDRIDLYMNFINHDDSSDDGLENLTIIPRTREMKMSKFPICFYVNNRDRELSVRIEYQTCVFDQKEISRLGERFIMCLEKIVIKPETSVQGISLVETTSIPAFSLG